MATIYIDNKRFEVDESNNLLHVVLSLGLNLPYFCWHPALGSVGACRQCAVKEFRDEKDTRGKIIMACMTPAKGGTRISIEDPEARAFRASIVEWLMENHPHDCPVCDEGGECHLQDMTLMAGHAYRRYRAQKRTFVNQYLGPFVNHEMNRCIQCYRCVRFYQDYAEGHDFGAFSLRNQVYFGRKEDGVLESEFSGNLVEVCPTGVFTDATLKHHYTRKWDLQTAPSVCVHCSVGCNTTPGERYGVLRRIRNRYNGRVNGYFLCDRGRYGYEFVNSERRIRQVMMMDESAHGTTAGSVEMLAAPQDRFALEPSGYAGPRFAHEQASSKALPPIMVTHQDACERIGRLIAPPRRVIGIGSPRALLESNFALRELVGAENFFQGVSEHEARMVALVIDILKTGSAPSASLAQVGEADAVLVLGEDVTNYAPMVALALRQAARRQPIERETARLHIPDWDDKAVREAIQRDKSPFFVVTPAPTKLEDVASRAWHAMPTGIARLGHAVARTLGAEIGSVAGLSEDEHSLAEEVANALKGVKRPIIVSGLSLSSVEIIQAAANVAWALRAQGVEAQLAYLLPEANSLGLGLLGGKGLEAALDAVQRGGVETLFILENDLHRRAPSKEIDRLLNQVQNTVVIDHILTPTAEKASAILPAATFAEGDGTLVNNEGRAQRLYQVFVPQGDIAESWRWLRDAAIAAGFGERLPWSNLDDVIAALAESVPVFKPILEIAPPANFRVAGSKIARESQCYTGRTANTAHLSVHEPKPPEDQDSPFSFSMEGLYGTAHPALISEFWAPGWNSIQSLNKFQEEVGGPLLGGDPGKRLLEGNGTLRYFQEIPSAQERCVGEWLAVPLYHVFGSEELSVLSPGIAEMMPMPYIALCPEDAQHLELKAGETLEIEMAGTTIILPLRVLRGLVPGLVGIPAGQPGMPPVGSDIVKLRKRVV